MYSHRVTLCVCDFKVFKRFESHQFLLGEFHIKEMIWRWYTEDMYYGTVSTSALYRLFALCVICSLLFSFALHAVQIAHTHFNLEHTHPHSEKSTTEIFLVEYMHLADKKLLVFLFIASLSSSMFFGTLGTVWKKLILWALRKNRSFMMRCIERALVFNYLRIFFKKGILHTKVY